MTTIDRWETSIARDPLGARLARLADPPVSRRFRAALLMTPPERRRPPLLVGVAIGLVALAAIAAGPARPFVEGLLPAGMQQRLALVSGAPRVVTRPRSACSALVPPAFRAGTAAPGSSYRFECRGQGGIRYVTLFVPQVYPLARAQASISFPLRQPAWLPAGIRFQGVLFPSRTGGTLAYQGSGGKGRLWLAERLGATVGGSAVPAGGVRTVMVGGHRADYVRGDYEEKTAEVGVWTPGADVEELTWSAGGITYDLSAAGLGLNLRELVAIAESTR